MKATDRFNNVNNNKNIIYINLQKPTVKRRKHKQNEQEQNYNQPTDLQPTLYRPIIYEDRNPNMIAMGNNNEVTDVRSNFDELNDLENELNTEEEKTRRGRKPIYTKEEAEQRKKDNANWRYKSRESAYKELNKRNDEEVKRSNEAENESAQPLSSPQKKIKKAQLIDGKSRALAWAQEKYGEENVNQPEDINPRRPQLSIRTIHDYPREEQPAFKSPKVVRIKTSFA
jgi:hypothetical protein